MKAWRNPGLWLTLAVLLGVGVWPVFDQQAALREVIFTVLRSVALASSLNIILGYTGYVSFGHIVFFGLGGYFGLYLMNSLGASLWLALPAGGLIAGLLAFALGKAILRLLCAGNHRRERSHARVHQQLPAFRRCSRNIVEL